MNQPELLRLLDDAEPGDVILIEQVDRLSRLDDAGWETLRKQIADKQLAVVSLDLPTSHLALTSVASDDFTRSMLKAVNGMMLDMLAAIAIKDYEDRRCRLAEGIRKAKAEGKYRGRVPDVQKHALIRTLRLAHGKSLRETYPNNPDLVVVDSKIIAKAPTRLLVSGMGDALSTWFEAKACYDSRTLNQSGGQTTRSALALARLCYDTLLEEGVKAKLACEQNVTSRALERIIEVNTYMSGIGFESSGLAAAHAIHNGLTQLPECYSIFHGEKVAFGTLTQLVMQNESDAQINEVLDFCIAVGLPVTLEALNITEDVHNKMRIVADKSCSAGETIFNMPFSVTPESLFSALVIADQLGRKKLGLSS